MTIHLFGYSNPVGQAFLELLSMRKNNFDIKLYSKNNQNATYIDLESKEISSNFKPEKSSIIISFAPIWIFSSFLEMVDSKSTLLDNVEMIISCSSSSTITKRFSFNNFDKNLSNSLNTSEEKIIDISKKNNLLCKIVQPTMIYGNVGIFKDKNVNILKKMISFSPFLILPNESGLRQPIHAKDLAEYIHKLIKEKDKKSMLDKNKILIGGHETLSYINMLERIKDDFPKNSFRKFCVFIKIPNRLFLFLVSPLILISPKLYESVLRITINLAGFDSYKVNQTKTILDSFPRR